LLLSRCSVDENDASLTEIEVLFMQRILAWYSFIPSFRPFLLRPFKSTTTQRRFRHDTDTVSEFHVKHHRQLLVEDLPRSLRGG